MFLREAMLYIYIFILAFYNQHNLFCYIFHFETTILKYVIKSILIFSIVSYIGEDTSRKAGIINKKVPASPPFSIYYAL